MTATCTCSPCTESGGPPTFHGDCCMGTMIVDYDASCIITDHRRLADAQYGTPIEGDDDAER